MLTAPVLRQVSMPMVDREISPDYARQLVDPALRGLLRAKSAKNA
jgi:hypothetical protein